jgi:dGTPase
MKWAELFSEQRVRDIYKKEGSAKIDDDPRTPFERDYDRTVFSTPFKRLQDKAQVFPLEEHDAVRTRLTHTMEVSCVARGLASAVAEIAKDRLTPKQGLDLRMIASTCGLMHDLGNPPFGHAGERAIVEWFEAQQTTLTPNAASFAAFGGATQFASDFRLFDGNAQTQRLISRLQVLSDEFGLNLTAATISASCKYTGPSHEVAPHGDDAARKKHGYFASENDLMQKIREIVGSGFDRNPIAVLVEAADDIVNAAADIEDGVRKQCFN